MATKSAELIRRLRALNEWPREVARALPQAPLDIFPVDAGQIAARKWFSRSYRAENGGTQQRPGSVSAGKFFPALALRATLIPSVRGFQRTRRMKAAQTFEQVPLGPIEWRAGIMRS